MGRLQHKYACRKESIPFVVCKSVGWWNEKSETFFRPCQTSHTGCRCSRQRARWKWPTANRSRASKSIVQSRVPLLFWSGCTDRSDSLWNWTHGCQRRSCTSSQWGACRTRTPEKPKHNIKNCRQFHSISVHSLTDWRPLSYIRCCFFISERNSLQILNKY